MDNLTPAQRTRAMRRVRSRDTFPERRVRSVAHRLGYRFRLSGCGLPGSPDLAFPRLRAAVFVHGCFWHQHECERGSRMPQTNRSYWRAKLARNVERDAKAVRALRRLKWRVLVVWECQTADAGRLRSILARFLAASEPPRSV
ncbi:MAG: DNA mismatch endonuclease Vsr [Planctomycetota bacterium]|nr:DNA mismatch endonuclease Vsr [Planctomycetota bacterium]